MGVDLSVDGLFRGTARKDFGERLAKIFICFSPFSTGKIQSGLWNVENWI
jgi:hypothetical protein